ncbi:uncharacterized protein LOC112576575 isoform X2 [Pomacea canaliculata]|uniref:uncharacterized protein LOC112576575 isoform X2 n=1 Tax=Pomacea canaliculata TaxID=400727 RepID=UPI000D7373B6|nr:uncharacterized protein LOC112576575 isoform X2 [Pomacea canaliculata]
MMILETALFVCLITLIVWWLLRSDPAPVAGVYPLPGKWYWLKRAIFSCFFYLRARQTKKQKQTDKKYNSSPRGYGNSMLLTEMEKCLPRHMDPDALDSVYIGAYSQDGPNLAMRVGRRPDRRAEIWLHLEIPGVGHLQHPVHPDTAISNTDPNSFTAGGLRFEVIEPLKTWRVSFSGQLRVGLCNSLENKPEKFLDTQFSFLWNAFAPPFNYDSDLDSSLLGDAIARERWCREFFNKLQKRHQTHYEQWGELRGTLTVEGHPPQNLRLTAIRDHSFGVRKWTDFYRYVYCFLHIENGMTLQIGAISQPGMFSHLRTGCLMYPSRDRVAVSDVIFNLWNVGEEEQQPPAKWSLSFVADGETYLLQVETKTSGILYHEADRGGIVFETFCNVTLNGKKGCGLSEFFYRNENRSEVKMDTTLPFITDPDPGIVAASEKELILTFSAMSCQSANLVGGKGSQLAQLTKLTTLLQDSSVLVPQGFCVTLAAFEEQMKHNNSLKQLVDTVNETAVSDLSKLDAVCMETTALFSELPMCEPVMMAVQTGLRQVFGADFHIKRLAVRSSAAGEDSIEASSAGQMDTFLGIQGEEEIFSAAKKCWASAYSYQAVEYRRQHGQPVRTPVGVVIQEMAPAEAAGVMFTSDPVTGNSSYIIIDANYGLGESVVSGKCEPDTITVQRNWDGMLSIKTVKTGKKSTKITVTDEGIKEEEVTGNEKNKLCLQDSVIIWLARVGIQIEKYFGSARDIEWAYGGGKIFLLQSRPITTSNQETEEELIHEFDSPLNIKHHWVTTANVGEMMPGAATPLTLSTFLRAINMGVQMLNHKQGSRLLVIDHPNGVLSYGNNLFLSILECALNCVAVTGSNMEALQVSILGEVRDDLPITTVKEYFGKTPPGSIRRWLNGVKMMKSLNKAGHAMKNWEERLHTYKLYRDGMTASTLYQEIDDHLQDYDDMWHWSIANSARSGSWSVVLYPCFHRAAWVRNGFLYFHWVVPM